ncbi:nucleotidyltransferase family protein [Qipengyuania sp. ASV99]|uniref:nucleotidyltransferase family protein n=1 Tax=Qipengyuania sp. ASV99 TaxID=3399681 RepID=UPI003A4C8063
MIDPSSVDRFLAATLRNLHGGKAADWSLSPEIDWPAVWARIEYHGIPFVLHICADQLDNWPPPLLARIAEEARLIALWETTHRDCVRALVSALAATGIDAVMMKGTALAYAFYDEPAARRRGDSDLLVEPAHREAARAILTRLGWYRRDDPHGLYHQEGWLHDAAGFFVHSVDLHWEPSDRPVLHHVLPMEQFFARKVAMPRFGEAAFRPDSATMILHGTINQKWHAQHGYESEKGRLMSPRRLIWSVDFGLLVRSMDETDWQRLTAHCAREGVGELVAEALRGARDDLGTPIPAEVLAQLDRAPMRPDLKAYFSNPDSLAQFRIDLRSTQGLIGKLRLVAARAFPPRSHLIEKYPQARRWPTLLLQARLLVDTARRALRQGPAQ